MPPVARTQSYVTEAFTIGALVAVDVLANIRVWGDNANPSLAFVSVAGAGAATIARSGADVTNADGFPIPSPSIPIELVDDSSLWVICDAAGRDVRVLVTNAQDATP